MVKSCRAKPPTENTTLEQHKAELLEIFYNRWMFLDVKMEVLRDYQHLPCVKEALEKAYVSSELTTT